MLDNLHCKPDPNESLQAEVALAAKYAGPGPRYTSYPTATQFADNFAVQPYLDWVRHDVKQKQAPLSLYVHVPFCSNICYYCACNKFVTRDETAAREYLSRLMTEIERQSELLGNNRPVTQMHWGGGSPTFLDNAELTELMHSLASHFRLVDKGCREYSIEIDPRTVDKDTIALLKGLGFNRISLGIQDLDPLVQKAINRIQPLRQIEALTGSIRNHNFRSLNFDLIYGLPYQDRDSVEETLRRVIGLAPDRIACYNYAHLPERFSSQRAIERLTLPTPGEKLLLQQIISHRLQEAGYQHIGMDHYVRPTDDLAVALAEGRLQRNFQGYSLQLADDLLGLGVSAISQLGDYYLQNTRNLGDYYARVDSGRYPVTRGCKISAEDKLRRHIIMSLISELRLDIEDCDRRFGTDFSDRFDRELDELQTMQQDGLLEIDRRQIRVTHSGRAFLRNICMTFDAYLNQSHSDPTASNFSATI